MENKKNHTFLSIFILIVFLISLSIIIIHFSQKETLEDTSNILPKKLDDSLLQIIDTPETNQQDLGTRREGYDINEKPFDESIKYEYDERTKDFRLVCTNPCPVSKSILDQEFAAISYGISTLRGLTQSDFESEVLPFEVHASEDSICPFWKKALAYASKYTDSNGYTRGRLCFFFDKLHYNRDKFPYSTSIHEVTHLLEYNKIERNSIIYEGLSEMMDSFFVKGNERNSFCWEGNDWFGGIVNNPEDPHGTGRQLFFTLCNEYGFDYDDLPALFSRIDKKGGVTIQEFVNIINDIIGRDSSNLFREAGVI